MKRQLANQVDSRHARIIRLSAGGVSNHEIARLCDCTPQWVRIIIHRFNAQGIEGITWYSFYADHTAQPRKFFAKIFEQIVEVMLSPPQRLIGPPQNGRVICVDEFGPLNLQPRHGPCPARDGQVTRHRATYNRQLGVRYFLAYSDLKADRLHGYVTEHKKTPDFLRFLKWVRGRYPRTQRLHIVLDNYGTHCSVVVANWAPANNAHLYFTPANASWLNRIECHFGPLKKFALNNSDYRSHEEQEAAIHSYLLWRNRRHDLAIQPLPKARNRAA